MVSGGSSAVLLSSPLSPGQVRRGASDFDYSFYPLAPAHMKAAVN